MTLITSLPEEVLSMVFNKINDLNTLAECRLACKAWSIPAERAMLGSTITISSDEVNKTRSLYAILKKNPEKAYSIKHLNFNYYTDPPQDDCTIDLLQIALAPNIESITGEVSEDCDLIKALMDIVEGSPNKLSRLKTLTLEFLDGEPPLRLLLHCRKTIQTTKLDYLYSDIEINWNFLDKLDEFINLTSLELAVKIGTISELDRILSKCSKLQKLSLVTLEWEVALDWDQQRIERNTNLKELSIREEDCPIEVLDYLLYKYPSIECAFVDFRIGDNLSKKDILKPLRLLQWVPRKELIYIVMEDADIRFILRCLIINGYKATIKELGSNNDIRIKIDY